MKPGTVFEGAFTQELKSRYLTYAMSTIMSRALPDVPPVAAEQPHHKGEDRVRDGAVVDPARFGILDHLLDVILQRHPLIPLGLDWSNSVGKTGERVHFSFGMPRRWHKAH